MTELTEHDFAAEKRVDFRSFKYVLRREWKVVAVCVFIALIFGFLNLRKQIYVYPVQMQLTSVQSNNDDSPTSRLGSLGGLAAIATAALPQNQNAMQFRLYVDSLRSRDIADELAKNQELMKYLFSDQWDPASGSWHEPPKSDYETTMLAARKLAGLAPAHPWQPPNGLDLLNYMNRNLSVEQDPRKAYMVRVVLVSPDTQFAMNFLNLLNRTIDDHLRQSALVRARAYVGYLSQQLAKVTIAEHRAAITQALSEQEKFAMVASSGAPFAAEMFEKPWASTLPAAPSPRQILGVAALIGAAIGSVLALIVDKLRRSRRNRKQKERFLDRGHPNPVPGPARAQSIR